ANLIGPYKVSVSGNYAYVTSRDGNALEIVDITDPTSPTHKGKILNGDGGAKLTEPYGVYVAGNYTYVASCASNALEIVDITDPASPTHKASITDGTGTALLSCPLGVYVVGNYAYVASTGSSALEIVNITDPASPTHKASITDGAGTALLSNPISVYVSGIYVYVASSGSNALEIVDIGNIPLTGASVVSASKITGTFDLTGRIAGLYHVVVVNPDNQFGTLSSGFTITNGTAAAPTVTGITPSSGQNTTTVSITNLAGTGFSGTPAVNLTRAGYSNITATAVTRVSASKLTCTFDLTNKMSGTWNINVTNPDGQQGVLLNGFTITNTTPAPTVTGITPSSGQNTTTVSITNLAGTGFSGTPTVNLTRAGYSNITATAVTLVSANQLTCTFDLTNKMSGIWNVNVTNSDGQQAALLNGFTITNSSSPAPSPDPTPASSGDNDVPGNARNQPSSTTSGVSIANGAPAGEIVTYSFGNPVPDYPVSIESISFVPGQSIGQSQCLITRVSPSSGFTVPDRPAVYESIQINWINPNVISEATIQFSVKGTWLREHNAGPQDIVMVRQHDLVWAEIPTVFDHVANDVYYYRATTPGFSNFAVSVRKNGMPGVITVDATIPSPSPTMAPVAAATMTFERTSSGIAVQLTSPTPTTVPTPAAGNMPGFTIPVPILAVAAIILLAAVGLLVRRWWIRRQNPALFRKYD
ncbi:MAG: PGF-pre-PGF domain-containing protein, partial [Methanoregula sp.]